MDSAAREVLIMIVGLLRDLDKTRRDQMASLRALVFVLCEESQDRLQRYREVKQERLDELADPAHDLGPVYDALIQLLKSPDQPEEDDQGKLRRILESFEGP